jgi:hypothetical protein
MLHLSKDELSRLVAQSEILELHRKGPKVLFQPDCNLIHKLFYPKDEWFSSDHLRPYAKRFMQNARILRERGISTVQIEDYSKVYQGRRLIARMVTYTRLEGHTLRSLDTETLALALTHLPTFLATLHHRGIYFHSLHLGNILWQETGFALIDIAHLDTYRRPLRRTQCMRNLMKLLNYKTDNVVFTFEEKEKFRSRYASARQNLNATHVEAANTF